MTRRPLVFAAAALLAALSPGASSASLIYDNSTTSFTGARTLTALLVGDEVAAGGTDRIVTQLEVGLSCQGQAATVSTLQAFLYANDGAGGAPGTLLWESAVRQNVALTGGNDLIAFAVPEVTVPDTFTWMVQVGQGSPVAAGLPGFGAPAVGSVVKDWFGHPGAWSITGSSANHYLARITATATAVPEPSTLAVSGVLCVTGLLGAWVRRRRIAA